MAIRAIILTDELFLLMNVFGYSARNSMEKCSPAHVGSGNHFTSWFSATHFYGIWNEGVRSQSLHHRVSPVDYLKGVIVRKLWTHVVILQSHQREAEQTIRSC